jgi:uncharacterized phage-associated protein
MATVFDVAAYILEKRGEMSAGKLQKLVYYSQAWSLVWDQRPLFGERIEAWMNGPVCPGLYRVHSGLFMVRSVPGGNAGALDAAARETMDDVLDFYGGMHPQELSELTHCGTAVAQGARRPAGGRALLERNHARRDGGVLRVPSAGCLIGRRLYPLHLHGFMAVERALPGCGGGGLTGA